MSSSPKSTRSTITWKHERNAVQNPDRPPDPRVGLRRNPPRVGRLPDRHQSRLALRISPPRSPVIALVIKELGIPEDGGGRLEGDGDSRRITATCCAAIPVPAAPGC